MTIERPPADKEAIRKVVQAAIKQDTAELVAALYDFYRVTQDDVMKAVREKINDI